jgi:hypothetical protein
MALHNFLNSYGVDDQTEPGGPALDEDISFNPPQDDVDVEDEESLAMANKREEIAQAMWDHYCQVLAEDGQSK